MKKMILSAVIASAIAATGIAQDKPMDPQEPREVKQSSQAAAKTMRGTINSIDNAGKSFVVKDESTGKEVTIYWDSATKVNGDLKVGNMVSFQASENSGKWTASSIEASSAKKPY